MSAAPEPIGEVVNIEDLRRRVQNAPRHKPLPEPEQPSRRSAPPYVPAKYDVSLGELEQSDAVQSAAKWLRDRATPWLLLVGPVGAGKSTIAGALAKELGAPRTCSFWPVSAMISAMKHEFKNPPEGHSVRVKIDNRSELVLDDLGTELDSAWQIKEVTDIVSHRYDHQLGLVATTNLTFGQLAERFGERTGSRLREMSTVLVVDGQDRRRPV